MEQLTFGQVYDAIKFILALASAVGAILFGLKKIMVKQLEPLSKKIDKLDINECRNYLVDFLVDVERGIDKDEIQIKRAYEIYDHYTNDLKGNSYIHDRWNKLMK